MMRIRWCPLVILSVIISIGFTCASASQSYNIVNTKVGQVRGIVVNTGGIITIQFLSIPYAQPPVGELRFQPPKQHHGWTFDSILDATRSRPACPRDVAQLDLGSSTQAVSEDCLYLDVYVPVTRSTTQDGNARNLPVLVKLLAGEFSDRASSYELRLADFGEMIVVGVKHRTGVLGYLAASDAQNFGLEDQRLAMQWVWDNIFEFGGNPDMITLFGEADTALSVGLHAISLRSRGLFTRAITNRGSFIFPGAVTTNSSASAWTAKLAISLGCDARMDFHSCLRNASLRSLLEHASILERLHAPLGLELWRPMVDGNFVVDKPERTLEKGQIKIAEYMIGESLAKRSNTCEDLGKSREDSPEDYKYMIRGTVARAFPEVAGSELLERAVSSILLEYPFREGYGMASDELLTDWFGLAPAELTVRLLSRVDRRVYGYSVCDSPSTCITDSGEKRGSKSQRESAQLLLERQQQQKRQDVLVWTAWINFIKTGNPNSHTNRTGSPTWRPFTELDRFYFEFCGTNVSAQERSVRARRMAFWNDYFPHLLQDVDASEEPRESQILDGKLRTANFQISESLGPIFWAIVAVAVLLLLTVILLITKLSRNKISSANQILDTSHRSWSSSTKRSGSGGGCWTSRRRGGNDSMYVMETRSLKHLPYCDET